MRVVGFDTSLRGKLEGVREEGKVVCITNCVVKGDERNNKILMNSKTTVTQSPPEIYNHGRFGQSDRTYGNSKSLNRTAGDSLGEGGNSWVFRGSEGGAAKVGMCGR